MAIRFDLRAYDYFSENTVIMEDSGEALNITRDDISEEEDAENPVLNVYGSPIAARGTALNRIGFHREPVAGSNRDDRDGVDRVVRSIIYTRCNFVHF